DPLAEVDVGLAFGWVGRAWALALETVGVAGAVVHSGKPRSSPWSAAVCFAGLGPGEVTVGAAKVVGISQRRTRTGSLFQCGALVTWDPRPLVDLLRLPEEEAVADLDRLAAGTGVDPGRLADTFARCLESVPTAI
ncbi:MAG: lipoate---protein ligase, partial [Actinomycetota bacterium]|nr:lipoate---protein ligase [Actinomycetota bacterium]